jgi:hypothetical protein
MSLDRGHDVGDLYDSERVALRNIKQAMQIKHISKAATTISEEDAMKRSYTNEVIQRCAEAGLVVDVLWNWQTLRCLGCSIKTAKPVTFDAGSSCPGCGDSDGQVHESSPDCSSDPDDQNLYWKPKVVVTGRTEKLKEFDHDRMKHEVRSGLLDGKVGGIREDGTFREDLKKKDYF